MTTSYLLRTNVVRHRPAIIHTVLITQVLHCPQTHNAENILALIRERFEEWSLDEGNQIAITTDNASVMEKMCKDTGKVD